MGAQYNQWRAMFAVMKASLRAMFRSPSAVVFTLSFPLVFILVFGFIGTGTTTVPVGFSAASDTGSVLYKALEANPAFKIIRDQSPEEMEANMRKGRVTAIVDITTLAPLPRPKYKVTVRTSTAGIDKIHLFWSVFNVTTGRIDDRFYPRASVADVHTETVPGRRYTTIDFILPGMLAFSLLSAAVFGTAFLFFSLRQTLVLKRFFATPIRRSYIVLGEGLSRMLFQLFGSIVIIGLGHFAFGFTLVHGFATFLEMLVLCIFGLVIFMGFGFVISSLAKNESTIPPLANLITLPQFLLAGIFVNVDAFPAWLQPICRVLPLTYLVDALRKAAFEGQHLWNVGLETGILALWGVAIYAVAVKVFKWE